MIIVDIYLGGYRLKLTNIDDSSGRGTRGLVALDDLRFATPTLHGGRVQWEYGTFTIDLSVLQQVHAAGASTSNWWPPPRSFEEVSVYWVDSAGTISPFPGVFTAWLSEAGRYGATYTLWKKDASDDTITDAFYADSLVNVFSSACTAMGLTLNSTYARRPSPTVYWTASGENKVLDNMDAMARFFGHRFWTSAGTLYLVDCLANFSTNLTLQYYELAELIIFWPKPVSKYVADYSPMAIPRVLLTFQEDDNAVGQICIAEVKIAKESGSALLAPTTVDVYPDSGDGNLIDDGNTSTYWFSGASTVPGAAVNIAYSSGIGEYAIQARAATPTYAPKRWTVKGWCMDRANYFLMGEVTSSGWGSLEIRRFPVDRSVNWPVELQNPYDSGNPFADPYVAGDPYQVAPVCARWYTHIRSALTIVQNIRERPTIRITLPIRPVLPGQYIFIDNVPLTSGGLVDCGLRVDSVSFNALDGTVTVEGQGGVS